MKRGVSPAGGGLLPRSAGERLFCMLAALTMLTSVCVSGLSESAGVLPPARTEWTAPDGDYASGEAGLWTLYLPGKNGMHLVAQHVQNIPGLLQSETMEAIVRELLSFPSNSTVDALGEETELTLYGDVPVEFSGGVATVNLGSSALGLSYRAFYTLSLALAATLCEIETVRCVNILVADQSVGLDVTGTLPMGSLTAHPGENLPVLWEQIDAKKTPLTGNMEDTPLTSYMTLYYPLESGQGIVCENRTITFPGQSPKQMAETILENLSQGSLYVTGVSDMPDLTAMLTHEPLTSELTDGGRMITLSFREGADLEWEQMGADPACVAAAMCYSLTTFIPGVAGVAIRVGDKPLTSLTSEKYGSIPVLGGLLRRADFEPFLMGRTTVYFTREGMLVPVEKSVARELADSPRAQLAALIDGPGARERAEGLMPTLPELVGEDDILGIAAEGEVLLVNLSESFRSEIQSWGRNGEMMLCYSMVNTLCLNTGARQVYFFFEGEQVEYIAGDIYWAGGFDYNTGLCEESFG